MKVGGDDGRRIRKGVAMKPERRAVDAGGARRCALDEQRCASNQSGNELIADSEGVAKPVPNTKLSDVRVARGWTQNQVAEAIADLAVRNGKTTGITANTVSRLERGYLSWPVTLVAEFETLFGRSAAELGFVNRRLGGGQHHNRSGGQVAVAAFGPSPSANTTGLRNIDVFETVDSDNHAPTLIAHGTPQLYIVANNEAYRRTFPGVTVGTNLLEWAVLNRLAREVMVEWELEVELLGNSMRQAASDPRNGEARAILRKCLEESPEFQQIFDCGHTEVQRPYPYQLLRDRDSGEIHRVGCSVWVANTNGEPAHLYIGKTLKEPPET